MAVKKGPENIRQFQARHSSIAGWLIAGVHLTLATVTTVALGASGMIEWSNPALWAIAIGTWGVGMFASLAILPHILRPLTDILAAIAHKTGELTVHAPPNPNSKHSEKTGLKSILQTLYSVEKPTDKEISSSKDAFLTEALNHTSCGVVILGPGMEVASANAAAPIGQKQDGTPFLALNFLGDETLEQWIKQCENEAINAERRWMRVSTDQRFVKKQRFFDVIASYEKGATAETVVFLIDQSERYMPEEDDLNFIAFAAHELRGPITVIRGYLDILEHELSDRMKGDEPELISRLVVSANRLSGYINNILNVAKFDRNHLQVHLYEDTVHTIYDSIADDMQLRAKAQHRMLNVNIPDNLPTVAADRGSISEVMANLIDNAVKYSFEGGVVEISATAKGEFVEIKVKDNGIGMPANVMSNVFRKFYRSHRSRESIAGTGIGLYICKAFVESHGGSISVTSRENEGSTFSFTLPIYATVSDKLLEDGQLNQSLVRKGGGWIKNHSMYRR